jgi:hypothetical protein
VRNGERILLQGWSSSEEAVTQPAELLAADMTEGSCVLCLESLSRSALHQRFSQVHDGGVQILGIQVQVKLHMAGSPLVEMQQRM